MGCVAVTMSFSADTIPACHSSDHFTSQPTSCCPSPGETRRGREAGSCGLSARRATHGFTRRHSHTFTSSPPAPVTSHPIRAAAAGRTALPSVSPSVCSLSFSSHSDSILLVKPQSLNPPETITFTQFVGFRAYVAI